MNQFKKYFSTYLFRFIFGIFLVNFTHLLSIYPVMAQSDNGITSNQENIFFADIIVRGNPVFQVGALDDLTAKERANIINRRLASVLTSTSIQPVNVDLKKNFALLKVNNRVLMTITTQDALDFNSSIEFLATEWAQNLNDSFKKPSLIIDVAQRLENTSRAVITDVIEHLPSFIGAIIVVMMTALIAVAVRKLAMIWAEKTEGDRGTEILISRLCYGAVWLVGAVVSLGILGLDFGLLLGTLGLTSVAIGFSLKDVLGNYISGVILLAARPFRINDQVIIGDYEGTVSQIQLRATTVQSYDGKLVYIPNQQVFQNSIVNITVSPIRRSRVMVGVSYNADLEEVKKVIKEALFSVEGIESELNPIILIHELAASTVNIEILFWVNSRRQSFLQVTSDVTQAVKEYLEQKNIEMPTEIYTIEFAQPIDFIAKK